MFENDKYVVLSSSLIFSPYLNQENKCSDIDKALGECGFGLTRKINEHRDNFTCKKFELVGGITKTLTILPTGEYLVTMSQAVLIDRTESIQ
jgi:hypothetical protein